MNKNIVVFDNFYSDPDSVRDLALEADLLDKNGLSENFAGNESLYNFYSKDIIIKFQEILGVKIEVDENLNAFGRFRFAQGNDLRKTQVHFDDKDWSAVIYLNDLNLTNAGTIFLEHKQTALIGPPQDTAELTTLGCQTISDFDRKFVLPDTLNTHAWRIHLRVPFKYNRLVLFRGKELFHASESLFGHDRESARLTQNFFFNEVE